MPARKKRQIRQIVEKDIDLPIPALYHQRHLSTIHVKEILSIAYDPSTRQMEITTRSRESLKWSNVPQHLRDKFAGALGYESFAEAAYWQRIHALPEPPEPKDNSAKFKQGLEALKGKYGRKIQK